MGADRLAENTPNAQEFIPYLPALDFCNSLVLDIEFDEFDF